MWIRLGLLFVLTVISIGCGGGVDKPPEFTVKGTVTFDGKPLESGSIVLDPVDGRGGSASGGIVKGEFELKSQPGRRIVRISAQRETGQKDEYGEAVTESYIPAQYNDDSTLEIEVRPADDNVENFKLDKKPSTDAARKR